MRCKKHITDLSSAVGVCASCLRERLFVIIVAEAQEDHRRRTDCNNNNPSLMLPRSVSPYIYRRKSDNLSVDTRPHQQEIQFQRFFSTPHIGPSGKIVADVYEKKKSKFGYSIFGKFFSSKSPDSGTSSRSWLETISLGRRRRKTKNLPIKEQRTICRKPDKVMLPAIISDDREDNCSNESSGTLSECSKQWKETPKRMPAWIPPGKRGHGRNGSGFGFCLSPLIRASPSRNWNQKGFPPE